MPKNNILKSSDGRWRYATTDQARKKLEIRSRKGEKKYDFIKRCNDLDKKAEGEQRDETLTDLFELWIKYHVKPNNMKGTLEIMPAIFDKGVKPFLGHYKIHEIKRKHVYKLLMKFKEKGLSPSYLQKIRTCISAPYNFAINTLGYSLISPTNGLIFHYGTTYNNKRRYFTDEELVRIFKSAHGTKYENLIHILSLTGFRPSEGLGLQITDIKDGFIHLSRGITIYGESNLKTINSKRKFPLYPSLTKVINDQISKVAFSTKEGWLFPSASGKPTMNAFSNSFKRILKSTEVWERGGRNGLKKLKLIEPAVEGSLYDFRHTFATKQAEQGMNPNLLKQLMGHSDIATTMKYYVGVTEKMMENAKTMLEEQAILSA